MSIDRGVVNTYVQRLRVTEDPPAMAEAALEDSLNQPTLRTGSRMEYLTRRPKTCRTHSCRKLAEMYFGAFLLSPEAMLRRASVGNTVK